MADYNHEKLSVEDRADRFGLINWFKMQSFTQVENKPPEIPQF